MERRDLADWRVSGAAEGVWDGCSGAAAAMDVAQRPQRKQSACHVMPSAWTMRPAATTAAHARHRMAAGVKGGANWAKLRPRSRRHFLPLSLDVVVRVGVGCGKAQCGGSVVDGRVAFAVAFPPKAPSLCAPRRRSVPLAAAAAAVRGRCRGASRAACAYTVTDAARGRPCAADSPLASSRDDCRVPRGRAAASLLPPSSSSSLLLLLLGPTHGRAVPLPAAHARGSAAAAERRRERRARVGPRPSLRGRVPRVARVRRAARCQLFARGRRCRGGIHPSADGRRAHSGTPEALDGRADGVRRPLALLLHCCCAALSQ